MMLVSLPTYSLNTPSWGAYSYPLARMQQPVETTPQWPAPTTLESKATKEPTPPSHDHEHKEASPAIKAATSLATAAGLFAVGRLLHLLPAHHPTFTAGQYRKWQRVVGEVVPLDWKDWARIFLGVGVVNQVNDAAQQDPAPWVKALETVTVLTPLMGASVAGKATWKHFPLLAVAVPGLVQGTHWSQEQLLKNEQIPTWLPNTVLPLLSTLAGMVGLRAIVAQSSGQVMGGEMAVCARCGGMHLVCPSEIGEFIGSFLNGHQSKNVQPQEQPAANPRTVTHVFA